MLGSAALIEEYGMSEAPGWYCWNIMQCNKGECSARRNDSKPCWVVAAEVEDYRRALNVCSDCLVYLSQKKNSILSEEEIAEILQKKGVCVLAQKCQDKKG